MSKIAITGPASIATKGRASDRSGVGCSRLLGRPTLRIFLFYCCNVFGQHFFKLSLLINASDNPPRKHTDLV
jgi:hypothetical protein